MSHQTTVLSEPYSMQPQQYLDLLNRIGALEMFLIAVAKTAPEDAVRANLQTAMETLRCHMLNSMVPDDQLKPLEDSIAAHVCRLYETTWLPAPSK